MLTSSSFPKTTLKSTKSVERSLIVLVKEIVVVLFIEIWKIRVQQIIANLRALEKFLCDGLQSFTIVTQIPASSFQIALESSRQIASDTSRGRY